MVKICGTVGSILLDQKYLIKNPSSSNKTSDAEMGLGFWFKSCTKSSTPAENEAEVDDPSNSRGCERTSVIEFFKKSFINKN